MVFNTDPHLQFVEFCLYRLTGLAFWTFPGGGICRALIICWCDWWGDWWVGYWVLWEINVHCGGRFSCNSVICHGSRFSCHTLIGFVDSSNHSAGASLVVGRRSGASMTAWTTRTLTRGSSGSSSVRELCLQLTLIISFTLTQILWVHVVQEPPRLAIIIIIIRVMVIFSWRCTKNA